MVLAFTLPKAYELKKDDVDSLAAKAHHHGKVSIGHLLHCIMLCHSEGLSRDFWACRLQEFCTDKAWLHTMKSGFSLQDWSNGW